MSSQVLLSLMALGMYLENSVLEEEGKGSMGGHIQGQAGHLNRDLLLRVSSCYPLPRSLALPLSRNLLPAPSFPISLQETGNRHEK